jgi:exodeoxyribonuclease III
MWLALCRSFVALVTTLATPGVAAKARHEHIYLGERFSDHAPLVIDYDLKL